MNSLLLFFSQQQSWNHGIAAMILTEALVPILASARSVHEAYPNAWLCQRNIRVDIAVLAGDETKDGSYLYAPFDKRPFGKNLPSVTAHQSMSLCSPPFDDGEPIPDDYQQPCWVIARREFSAPASSRQEWRSIQRKAEMKPHTNLKQVYVGCSYCGYGRYVKLESGVKVYSEGDRFYVRVAWRRDCGA